jgi:hypothetical protein
MAKKPAELVELSDEHRAEYLADRGHLYVLSAASICSMSILQCSTSGAFVAERYGDYLNAAGWMSRCPFDQVTPLHNSDISAQIDAGDLPDFRTGENLKLISDIMIQLSKAPLPF